MRVDRNLKHISLMFWLNSHRKRVQTGSLNVLADNLLLFSMSRTEIQTFSHSYASDRFPIE